jgi:hypothetical protein
MSTLIVSLLNAKRWVELVVVEEEAEVEEEEVEEEVAAAEGQGRWKLFVSLFCVLLQFIVCSMSLCFELSDMYVVMSVMYVVSIPNLQKYRVVLKSFPSSVVYNILQILNR